MRSKQVGVVLVGVPDITGGGGAERYFVELCQAVGRLGKKCDATLISDVESLSHLASATPVSDIKQVLALDLDRVGGPARQRFSIAVRLHDIATSGKFDVLHIAMALPRHLLWLLPLRKSRKRCQITLNLNDYRLSRMLSPAGGGESVLQLGATQRASYSAYFRWAPLDGVMSWYEDIAEGLRGRYGARFAPVTVADYCFVDPEKFRPTSKSIPLLVYVARLVPEKRPELFLRSLAVVREIDPEGFARWQYKLFGKGPLEGEVRRLIVELGLSDQVQLDSAPDLSAVFGAASVFVSTQDHENFTSLSMLEAMACANAVVARDVGRTERFVEHGRNGVLVSDHSPHALGAAIHKLIGDPVKVRRYGEESRRIVLETHSAENVVAEFEQFWCDGVGRTGRDVP